MSRQSALVDNLTRRCALVYYAYKDDPEIPGCKQIFILLGIIGGQLTSIGGRKKSKESDIDCCCREVFEETKELVNFYPYKHGLHSGTIYTYHACNYYILEESYDDLVDLCNQFKMATSDKPEQNELSDLVLFDIDHLVRVLLRNAMAYKDELKDFVLEALYRLLKPAVNRGLRVVEIDEEANLLVPISKLPNVIDILPTEDICILEKQPKIFGTTKQGCITECIYP